MDMAMCLEKLAIVSGRWQQVYKDITGEDSGLPMRWSIDPDGILWLDHAWICPAHYVDVAKLDDCYMSDIAISLPTRYGDMDILIICDDKPRIGIVERYV